MTHVICIFDYDVIIKRIPLISKHPARAKTSAASRILPPSILIYKSAA